MADKPSAEEYLDAVDALQEAVDNLLCLIHSPFVAMVKGREKVVKMVTEEARAANLLMSSARNRLEMGIFGTARSV
jgi:hypothetical protein